MYRVSEAAELSSHPVNLEEYNIKNAVEDDPNPITADVDTCVPKVEKETEEELQLQYEESVGDNFTSDSFSSQHIIVKR